MNETAQWIRNHQLVAFFIIVFAFWPGIPVLTFVVFPSFLSSNRLAQLYLSRVAIYGPALAGMIVTLVAAGKDQTDSSTKRWIAFLISWSIAIIASVFYHLRIEPLGESLTETITLLVPIALLPAVVISGAYSGSTNLRSYLSTLVRPKGRIIWYLVALLFFPAIHLLGNVITHVVGNTSSAASVTVTPGLLLATFLTFLRVFFFTGGINEESGWRGFALPRLQVKYSPLLAALIIWFLHMIWELPGDLLSPGSTWPMLSRLVLMPCWSILFMWVYNRTEGSILAPVLFHASMNSMNPLMGVLPVSNAVTILLIGCTLFAVVYDRMWQKLPPDNPAVYQGRVTTAGGS